jgi:hypothetical protein
LDGGLKGITTTGRRSRNGHAKPNHGNGRCSRVFTRGDFIMMAYSADAVQQRDCFDMLLTSQKEVSAYTTKLTFVDAGALPKLPPITSCLTPLLVKNRAPVQTKKGENMDTNTAQQLDDTRKVRMIKCTNDNCYEGKIVHDHDCWAHGYSDEGCPECHNMGKIIEKCETCDGTGYIPVTEDEGLDCFKDITYAEAFKVVSNQIMKEGR